MPNKKGNKPALRAATAKTNELREAGRGLLQKLEDQVKSLTEIAEENLEQGLLGHYAEAMKMRDSAEQTLEELRKKLGLPDVEGVENEAPKDVRIVKSNEVGDVRLEEAKEQPPQLLESPVAEKPLAKEEAHERNQLLECSGGAKASPLMPRYNWLPAEGDNCVLEILGPCSDSAGSDASLAEIPDVDISDAAVRCRWEKSGWQLTLPVGFQVDQTRCKVVRRRRTGRLELYLTFSAPAPAPEHLQSDLVRRGFGWHDGFLAAAEADAVRARLKELWEGGQLQQGEVEGGVREKVRSDSYLFMEEGDPVISTFTRRLDRLVLAMAKEVPELKGLWLMRGRPMAAVYAGAGSRYAPHFDCVAGDNGRKITCIMYLNPFWQPGDGAELQIFPEARGILPSGPCHEIEPLHGRLACFLCDSKNLHAVKPVANGDNVQPRMAISCWYYDSEGGKFHREDENDALRPRDHPLNKG